MASFLQFQFVALAVKSGVILQVTCLQGLGIMQMSVRTCQRLIDSGELVEVLPELTPPSLQVSLRLPHRRHIAPRIEAVPNRIIKVTRPHMNADVRY